MHYSYILATRFCHRLRGLMGSKNQKEMLVISPCKEIHTFGMKRSIDVAFIDHEGWVLAVYRDVKPYRRLRQSQSAAVLERFSDESNEWFRRGQKIVMTASINEEG